MGKMKAGPIVTDNGCAHRLLSSLAHGLLTHIHSRHSNFVIDANFDEAYMRDPAELLHRIKMCVASCACQFIDMRLRAARAILQADRCPRGRHLRWHGTRGVLRLPCGSLKSATSESCLLLTPCVLIYRTAPSSCAGMMVSVVPHPLSVACRR